MRFINGFTLLEVMVAVLVVSVGFAGVMGWLNGHSQVQKQELRQWALLRMARNTYAYSRVYPTEIQDSFWDFTAYGQIYHAKLDVLDSLEWPFETPYRPWPREVMFQIDAPNQNKPLLQLFWAVGGFSHVP